MYTPHHLKFKHNIPVIINLWKAKDYTNLTIHIFIIQIEHHLNSKRYTLLTCTVTLTKQCTICTPHYQNKKLHCRHKFTMHPLYMYGQHWISISTQFRQFKIQHLIVNNFECFSWVILKHEYPNISLWNNKINAFNVQLNNLLMNMWMTLESIGYKLTQLFTKR